MVTKIKLSTFSVGNRTIIKILIMFIFLIGSITLFPSLFLVFLFIALEFFSTWFEMHFKIEPGPDFIMCGIIIFSYVGMFNFAFLLMPFIIVSKLIFARFKLRHLLKPLIYLVIAFLANYLNSINLVFLAVFLSVFRYIFEYLIEYIIFGTISIDRIIPRVLRIFMVYFFFLIFSSIILKLL